MDRSLMLNTLPSSAPQPPDPSAPQLDQGRGDAITSQGHSSFLSLSRTTPGTEFKANLLRGPALQRTLRKQLILEVYF